MVHIEIVDICYALLGGAIIAMAATINLLFTGRITGMSGILSSVTMVRTDCGLYWKATFIIGLLTPGIILVLSTSRSGKFGDLEYTWFDDDLAGVDTLSVIIGGILVGFGTRLGNGCTSGHGVCGLPRLALRSVVAVCTFMGVAIAISTSLYYIGDFEIGFMETFGHFEGFSFGQYAIAKYVILPLITIIMLIIWAIKRKNIKEFLVSYICGLLFAIGLLLSGMTRVTKIKGFLTMNENWDISLIFVMLSAVVINFVTFKLILRRKKPLILEEFSVPKPGGKVDVKLIVGSVIFGAGWGICGCCPGPTMIVSVLSERGILMLLCTIIGMYMFEIYTKLETAVKAKQNKNQIKTDEKADLLPFTMGVYKYF